VKGTEIAFVREVIDPSQTTEVFVEMVKQPAKNKPLCYPKRALCDGSELCHGATQSGSSFATALILVLTGKLLIRVASNGTKISASAFTSLKPGSSHRS
jgi:hypothetical protein